MTGKVWNPPTDEEIAQRDIAEWNLISGYGLPPTGAYDVAELLRRLDQWADLVDNGVLRAFKRGAQREFPHQSDNEFRIMVMITVLQRDLGVAYNHAFSEGEYDGSDSRNLFLHGLLTGHGGTCVTMPMLYVAIGRRLGWPLKIAFAKEHVFCRWDEPNGERFNIEATSRGFNRRTDEHYMSWPKSISQTEIEKGLYLRNITRREELAEIFHLRGICCLENIQTLRAVEAFYRAHHLIPDHPQYALKWGLAILLHRAFSELKQQAAYFPKSRVLVLPASEKDWERSLEPLAREWFDRILRNKRRRIDASARESAIQQLT